MRRSNLSVSFPVISIRRCRRPVRSQALSSALHQPSSIIRTGRLRLLRLSKCAERERREPQVRFGLCAGGVVPWCARVVWSSDGRWCAAAVPSRSDTGTFPRSSGTGASAGRGRFRAHGHGWRLPLVARFAPACLRRRQEEMTDGSRPLLCCAVRFGARDGDRGDDTMGRCTPNPPRLDRTTSAWGLRTRRNVDVAGCARVRGVRQNW